MKMSSKIKNSVLATLAIGMLCGGYSNKLKENVSQQEINPNKSVINFKNKQNEISEKNTFFTLGYLLRNLTLADKDTVEYKTVIGGEEYLFPQIVFKKKYAPSLEAKTKYQFLINKVKSENKNKVNNQILSRLMQYEKSIFEDPSFRNASEKVCDLNFKIIDILEKQDQKKHADYLTGAYVLPSIESAHKDNDSFMACTPALISAHSTYKSSNVENKTCKSIRKIINHIIRDKNIRLPQHKRNNVYNWSQNLKNRLLFDYKKNNSGQKYFSEVKK